MSYSTHVARDGGEGATVPHLGIGKAPAGLPARFTRLSGVGSTDHELPARVTPSPFRP